MRAFRVPFRVTNAVLITIRRKKLPETCRSGNRLATIGADWHKARGSYGCNDVWSSADGVTWRLETQAAPWQPRTGAYVFSMTCEGKPVLAVAGGYDGMRRKDRQWRPDIWISDDGANWKVSRDH